jgi:hypothetical protein
MNKSRKTFSLDEAKIQASILLKSARSCDPLVATSAMKRLQGLPEFANSSVSEIAATVKRKHALAVLAQENGFVSWPELKSQIRLIIGGFLNKWFTTYDEAKAEQQAQGGFLFPYKHQFFICEAAYIKQLGWNPKDPDWALITHDWVKPADTAAKERLLKKWKR